jgi:hypothetical protein
MLVISVLLLGCSNKSGSVDSAQSYAGISDVAPPPVAEVPVAPSTPTQKTINIATNPQTVTCGELGYGE